MYRRIMLTLDTSELAERALPHAMEMATAFGAELCILSVVPVSNDESGDVLTSEADWKAQVAHTEEYIAGVLEALQSHDIKASAEIRRGNVTDEILIFSEKFEADLIVMSSHGRSGLGRWVYGSVTDRVLRYADCPVLLIRVVEAQDEQD